MAMKFKTTFSNRDRNAIDTLKPVMLLLRIFALLPVTVKRNEIIVSKIYSHSISTIIIALFLCFTFDVGTKNYSNISFRETLFIQKSYIIFLNISTAASVALFRLSDLKEFWETLLYTEETFIWGISKWINTNFIFSSMVTTQLFFRCLYPYFQVQNLYFNGSAITLLLVWSFMELYCFCSIIFYVQITCLLEIYYQNIYQHLSNIARNNIKVSAEDITKFACLHQTVTDLKNSFNRIISLPIMTVFLDQFLRLSVNIYNCILKIIAKENDFIYFFSIGHFIYKVVDCFITTGVLLLTSFYCAGTVSYIYSIS